MSLQEEAYKEHMEKAKKKAKNKKNVTMSEMVNDDKKLKELYRDKVIEKMKHIKAK